MSMWKIDVRIIVVRSYIAVYKQVQMIDDPRTETVEQMIYTQYYYRDNSLLRTDSDISYEIDSYFAMTEVVESGGTICLFSSEE